MRNNFFVKLFCVTIAMVVILPLSQAFAQLQEVENLGCNIETIRAEYRAADNLDIRFTITNNSDSSLNVLKWNTPFEGFNGNIFNVTRNERPVIYLGRMVKRGKPQPEDYMTIGANESTSIEVNLAEAYGIYEVGEYSIEFRTILLDLGHAEPAELSAKQVLEPKLIRSNIATLILSEAKEKPEAEAEAAPKDFSPKAAAFRNCSASEQAILNTALSNAQSYASGSLLALVGTPESDRPSAERYTTWFGTYTATRYNTVTNHFQEIYDALTNETITFHCDCDDDSYAYVFPTQEYHIYLCNLFWAAPAEGTDSQLGTIIHEVSHFNVVAGTDDHAYGQANCQTLADNDPTKAIDNADSHEYFAENNPSLSMGLNLALYSLALVLLIVFVYSFLQIRKRMQT